MKNERATINRENCHLASLLQQLDSQNTKTKQKIAEGLGSCNISETAIICLKMLTTDSDSSVREKALISVAKFNKK